MHLKNRLYILYKINGFHLEFLYLLHSGKVDYREDIVYQTPPTYVHLQEGNKRIPDVAKVTRKSISLYFSQG